MSFSYFEGFIISLIIVIVVASIISIIVIYFEIVDNIKEKDWIGIAIAILVLIIINVMFAAILFILIYPILNLLLQIHLYSVLIISEELEKGILFLRFSSLLLGLSSLKYYRGFFSENKSYLDNKYFEKFKEFKDLAPVQEFDDFILGTLLQYAFFMINIVFLWVFVIFQMEGLLMLFLNWAVFFITDDWLIILKYSELLKGRFLPSHKYRLLLFNVTLSICLIIIFFVNFNLIFAIISTIVVCIVLFFLLIKGIEENNN